MPGDANGPVDDGGSLAEHLMTAEELLDLPEDHLRHELVRGELRTMPLEGFQHGRMSASIGARLGAFVEARSLGDVVAGGTGFILIRDPDTVRAPDAAFVAVDRVPPPGSRAGFAELAPDLAVEVVSPNDRTSEVTEKALMWVDAGVRLVWVVDPASRTVTVYRPGSVVSLLRGEAELDGEDVLPGFRLALGELFG